jgi:hypothetical protein
MVSTARDPKRRFRFILGFCSAAAAVAIVIMIPGCGLDERRAGRLHEQAARQVDGHDLEGAVATLQRVIDRYPGTRAAAAARKEIVLYRGLIDAARRFPTRRASDVVIAVARAIERYRDDRNAFPSNLRDLVPTYLTDLANDPWGRPLIYESTSRSTYVLKCLGADGVEGGAGESADLVVRNGRFVKGDPEGGP